MNNSTWDALVRRANESIANGRLEEEEIGYKVKMGQELASAQESVINGASGWPSHLKHAMRARPGHPMNFRTIAEISDWCANHSSEALEALQSLWRQDRTSVDQRIREFCHNFPRTAVRGALGIRTTVISVLLMASDVYLYPPFRIRVFNKAYELTGYSRPDGYMDEATLYQHALGFLDRFIQEAEQRGVKLRHRLDAQSVLWMLPSDIEVVKNGGDEEDKQKGPEQVFAPDLADLGQRTYLTEEFLEEIVELLEDKKQVIFQGPPGTGKTYVAQELAECLAGSTQRVTLVQFHPSYAYEDFVQGFRPSLVNGQAGFELREGPLKRAADNAKKESDKKHFLVIDEINRGNLAKVFGELYFLLEYRDREMSLQYSNEPFSLPQNLYIIGTMNTADRSIALVDLALRRRFHFVEFHPDEEPVKSVLNRFLKENASGLEWVADVVDKVNALLQKDRDAAIGPSYFMKDNLTEESVKRIWKHNILPYISELLHGQPERLKEFNLEALRAANTSVLGEANGATEQGAPHDGPSGSTG